MYSKYCVAIVFQCINVLIVLWKQCCYGYQKGFLKMELLLLYVAIFTIILSSWLYICVYSNNFVHFFFWSGLGMVVGLTSS